MSTKQNLEIERKFLIKYPDLSVLESNEDIKKAEIIQTYTSSGARLRSWLEKGRITYIKTVKKHLTDITRIEEEYEISKEEYEELMADAISQLKKIRYRMPYMGHLMEIDIFPFWSRQAFLEVELKGEDEEFFIPDFINIIKEVTEDKAYRNFALSKNVPKEENF